MLLSDYIAVGDARHSALSLTIDVTWVVVHVDYDAFQVVSPRRLTIQIERLVLGFLVVMMMMKLFCYVRTI